MCVSFFCVDGREEEKLKIVCGKNLLVHRSLATEELKLPKIRVAV